MSKLTAVLIMLLIPSLAREAEATSFAHIPTKVHAPLWETTRALDWSIPDSDEGSLLDHHAPVVRNARLIHATAGRKHVTVNLTEQVLKAWQGGHLVLQCRISSGRFHSTPTGDFQALSKSRMHYSTLFQNAPMPWSVQICGQVFIHGFSYVPSYPASHGCIRLPISDAHAFYDWVDLGTPIEVIR